MFGSMSNPPVVPDYSVIIPAFNEAQFLPKTLDALASAMDSLELAFNLRGEVIVVNNNSSDDTAGVAQQHKGLRGRLSIVDESENQISKARNRGAAVAKSVRLIFVDADTNMTSSLLHGAIAALNTGAVAGGTLIAIDIKHAGGQLATTLWNQFAKVAKYAAGCFVFCRKDAFDAVGGFSEKVYASEEIWLARALKKWGKPRGHGFVVLEEHIVTSARKLEWLSTFAMFRQMFVIVLFPFALKYKRFCNAWYKRPEATNEQ